MRFTSAILAAAAFASSALAQTAGFAVMTSPTQDQQIPAGSSFDLIWTPGTPTGPISIVLLQGDTAATLQVGATLATGVPSTLGKFTYTVPATSSFKTYGFQISLDSDPKIFQYSFPFHVSGASSSSSSASATKSSTSSSSSGSSSSSSTSTGSSKSSTYHHSSSVTGVTTTVPAPTGASNATTPIAPVSSSPAASPYSNSTTLLSTTAIPTGSSPSTTAAGGSGTGATSTPAVVTPNAAVAKVASAGLALGGLFMAFAL